MKMMFFPKQNPGRIKSKSSKACTHYRLSINDVHVIILIMKINTLIGEELYNAIHEMRSSSDQYEELVFFSKDISDWYRILTEKLGPPVITAEKINLDDASKETISSKKDAALKLAKSYGGISKGQTLYYGTYDSTVISIMIWPWQDNAHVTLKKIIV